MNILAPWQAYFNLQITVFLLLLFLPFIYVALLQPLCLEMLCGSDSGSDVSSQIKLAIMERENLPISKMMY